jgi:saccharopine dehydrogenase-like NADP-dependent oxidoreductase
VYLYQATDAQEVWQELGLGAVAWQTGFNPVIAMELLANGSWGGAGVLGPEAFDATPFLALLDNYGIHHAMVEMTPGAHLPT